jgi:hypothetical protein
MVKDSKKYASTACGCVIRKLQAQASFDTALREVAKQRAYPS